MNGGSPLNRLRNNPNFAGFILAVLAFCAAILILSAVPDTNRQTNYAVAAGIAALVFYKGRRAVQKRLDEE